MKRFLLIILIISAFSSLFAVPAYPYPIVFTQPNGEQVTLIMKGDEFVKFAQTLDGYTLLYNPEGYFCYAQKNAQGDIEPSAFYAKEISKRNMEVNKMLLNIPKELRYSKDQTLVYRQIRNMVESESRNSSRGNTTGVRKLLTILMQYPDKPFVKTQEDFDHLFNQIKYTEYEANGSVKDFFLECSYNKLEVQTTVVGPFTAQRNWAYYGADFWNARELATEAVYAAASGGVNFADFATNGEVPSFYMIFAGHGEEAGGGANSIWSHAWGIDPVYLNGVLVSTYACSPELRGGGGSDITRIGVICHEFGHSLGAPDYYDTDYGDNGSYEGTGYWELQASGSWNDNGRTPAPPNPRSKVYTYEWATAIVLNSAQTVTIPSARIYDNAYFRINTQTPNEYFILENKIRGSYDDYISGVNMLIYHCAANLNDMNTTSPQKFYPVAANAPVDLPRAGTSYRSDYGTISSSSCPWPGSSGKTEFTDNTIPAMLAWSRTPTGKPITNITVHNNYITFDIMGGGPKSEYLVFLPNYYGCVIIPEAESVSPVVAGENFSFKIILEATHNESDLVIKANGETIVPINNIYTLSNIQSDQVVTIEGLKFNTVDITASAEVNGTISPEGTIKVPVDNTQRFDITANLGFVVDDVFVDGISVGPVTQYVFKNVTEPHQISAHFKYGETYSISASTNLLQFAAPPGVVSETQIVTINSAKLAGSILIAAPDKFEISGDGKKWYKTFMISQTKLPFQLYVRYIPKAEDIENVSDKLTLCSVEAYSEIMLMGNLVLQITEKNKAAFSIYPNPTTGVLNLIQERIINYEFGTAAPLGASSTKLIENVEVFDVYGKKQIFDIHYPTSEIEKSEIEINISHLPTGIYLIAFKTASGIFYEKIIKH